MCFSQNGKHLITTSSVGCIYIWKLPTQVAKLMGAGSNQNAIKSQLKELKLDQIDEEELEDTGKRKTGSQPPQTASMKSPRAAD